MYMITVYTGTPGSGKSLHVAKDIYNILKFKKYAIVITNILIKEDKFNLEQYERYIYIETGKVNVYDIWELSENWYNQHEYLSLNKLENCVYLILDEAQLLFNARAWQSNSKLGWTEFFSLHRHVGLKVILITQMLTNLDKQVRGLVEFECIHYKIKNMGYIGLFFNLICFGGLFRYVEYWTPKNEKIQSYFFKYKKYLGDLYDTHALFKKPDFKSKTQKTA